MGLSVSSLGILVYVECVVSVKSVLSVFAGESKGGNIVSPCSLVHSILMKYNDNLVLPNITIIYLNLEKLVKILIKRCFGHGEVL